MKTIEFIASSKDVEEFVDIPVPSSTFVPDWYKKSFRFKDSNKPNFNENHTLNNTIKSCIPVFDAMTAGYIQKTWCDIFIEIDDYKNIFFRWSSDPQIINTRESWNKQLLPTPVGHYDTMLTWTRPWGFRTPKNYSVMLIHPAYRDLPFTCFPGIIDTDFYHREGDRSVPFFIKEGFSGLIPAGTPMYQIIPIKRDSWSSIERPFNYQNIIKNNDKLINTKFYDKYKKIFWQKKSYI